MSFTYGSDKKSAVQAKHDAQKIAFAPIMFQAAKALRDLGILKYLMDKKLWVNASDEFIADMHTIIDNASLEIQ